MRFTVGQLAKIFNISAQAIHGYVDMGILPCERDDNGYRYFDDYSFQILGTIIKNRNIGFALKDSDYVYQKSNLLDILNRLQAQDEKLNGQLNDLFIQRNQLNKDIVNIQQALLQQNQSFLKTIEPFYRYNLGNSPNKIVDYSKNDTDSVSKWYSHLFYTQSSLVLNYQNEHIQSIQYCLMTTKDNYHHFCEHESTQVKYIEANLAITCMSTYKNNINLNLLESLIINGLSKFKEYKLVKSPYTRLITSFSDEQCEKVNVFELIIPVKKL